VSELAVLLQDTLEAVVLMRTWAHPVVPQEAAQPAQRRPRNLKLDIPAPERQLVALRQNTTPQRLHQDMETALQLKRVRLGALDLDIAPQMLATEALQLLAQEPQPARQLLEDIVAVQLDPLELRELVQVHMTLHMPQLAAAVQESTTSHMADPRAHLG